MRMPERVRIPSLLNSQYFENLFFERLNYAFQHEPDHLVFDMREMVWSDLMELLCIPLALCWLKRQGYDVELDCFRPFFSRDMEGKVLEISGSDKSPISADKLKEIRNKSKYKGYNQFFWGSLLPLDFFERILELDIPCYLEDWHQDRIPLTRPILDIISPKESTSLRFYGIENIYTHAQVDSAVNDVREIMKNLAFRNAEDFKVYIDLIYNIGENVFDHAYLNQPDTPEQLKKGFVAMRLFSSKGFGQILRHAPREVKKYFEYLKNREVMSICVVDAGNGIWSSLDPRKTLSELDCIKYAFEKNVTSKPQGGKYDPKRGVGLYEVQKSINEEKGYLEIRSGRSRYVIMPEDVFQGDDKALNKLSVDGELEEFPGVQYRIYIPLKKMQRSLFDKEDQ